MSRSSLRTTCRRRMHPFPSPPRRCAEGLYDAEPEPEEPTRVFQAITEEGAESGDAAYARARNYARADEDDAPARRSFQDSVLNPLMARLAAVAYRVRAHNNAVHGLG